MKKTDEIKEIDESSKLMEPKIIDTDALKSTADVAEKPKPEKPKSDYKLFGKWSTDVVVNDPGIRPYVNLKGTMMPRSAGINQKYRFHKSKINIVERLALHLMVPGHAGRKHKLSSGRRGGAYESTLRSIEKSFGEIEKATGKNPVEVFVKAIENAALREEITSVQMGSIMARSAVITSPQRRIDRVLRMLAQGTYKRCYGKKLSSVKALANEIVDAYNNSDKSLAVSEKNRLENEAEGAR